MKWLHFFVLAIGSLLFAHVGFSNTLVNSPVNLEHNYSKENAVKITAVDQSIIATEFSEALRAYEVTDVGKSIDSLNIIINPTYITTTAETSIVERPTGGYLLLFSYKVNDLIIEFPDKEEKLTVSYWHLDYKHKLLRSCVKNC